MILECPECHHPQWDYPHEDDVCGSLIGVQRSESLYCQCRHATHTDPAPFDAHRRFLDRRDLMIAVPAAIVLAIVAVAVAINS